MSRLFVELRDGVENRQARARRALGVVVMRRRPAEVGHHAVAEVLRDVPVEARYRFGRRAMKSREGLAPFLGIEPRGDRGRAHQVAEQHRQMTPLTSPGALALRVHRRLFGIRLDPRRSEAVADSVNEEPQRPQNFARGGLSNPHLRQWRSNAAPHSMQNLVFSGFSRLAVRAAHSPSPWAPTLDQPFL